ncbi:MAG: hypothetical protein HC887_00495 [Desulfobacteraceae bacterium]|nr:hypothetical protein [Desulfobacteraceae bacterium]
MNIRDSFRYAADIIGFLSIPGSSRLDDNGNGIGNEISDGQLALNTLIGLGIKVAGAFPGDVRGTITDNSGRAIEDAKISTDAKYIVSSLPNGKFLMANHPAGTFRVTIEAEGYQTATAEVSVTEWGITVRDIRLNPMPPPTPDITPPPAAPVPDVSVSGTTATVSWDAVSGATGYRLLYRYPSDVSYKDSDVGNRTSLSVPLPEGTVLYVAVQAYNSAGSGISSDARYISIPVSRLDVGHAGDDLKLDISCALYDGNQYSVSLILSPQPSDTLIWKADIGNFGKITESPTPCLAVGDDLKLRLNCGIRRRRYSFI